MEICQYCRRPVIWAAVADGKRTKPIAIEACQPGRGNVALALALFGGAPLAELVVNGTGFRVHREHCSSPIAAGSFSGMGRRRKDRPSRVG